MQDDEMENYRSGLKFLFLRIKKLYSFYVHSFLLIAEIMSDTPNAG